MMNDAAVIEQQDALRPFRQFVGMVGGAIAGWEGASQQSDVYAGSWPGQYQVPGRAGVAVEGTSITVAPVRGGGVYISPAAVLVGIVAAVLFFRK